MEFREVVRKRRMVRRFEQRSVPRETIDRLLDTARRGPSAGFSQGSDFVVLDRPKTIARFWEITTDPRWPMEEEELAAGPTVLVLLFSDKRRYLARYSEPDKAEFGLQEEGAWPVPFWDTDTAMAGMLLLLAAVNEGLGGWYFGLDYGEAELRRELRVPDDRRLVGLIGLGFPDPEETPTGSWAVKRRRPLEEMVHRNGWTTSA